MLKKLLVTTEWWSMRWTTFYPLGRSTIVRSSYIWAALVPIAVKMLSKISTDFVLPFKLKQDLHIEFVLGVPFKWELLYYSSVCFAIASLIYALCCPEIVKKYGKYSDFVDEGKGPTQLIEYAYGIGGSGAKPDRWHQRWLSEEQFLRFGRRFLNRQESVTVTELWSESIDKLGIGRDKQSDAFFFIRNCADLYLPAARCAALVLYGSGFGLFAYVLIRNFMFVVSHSALG